VGCRFGGVSYFRFDKLTLVPIQAKLIDLDALTKEEEAWLDDYHTEACSQRGAEGGGQPGAARGGGGGCSVLLPVSRLPQTARARAAPPFFPWPRFRQVECHCLISPVCPPPPRAQVWDKVSPRLQDKPDTLAWLRDSTRPMRAQIKQLVAA